MIRQVCRDPATLQQAGTRAMPTWAAQAAVWESILDNRQASSKAIHPHHWLHKQLFGKPFALHWACSNCTTTDSQPTQPGLAPPTSVRTIIGYPCCIHFIHSSIYLYISLPHPLFLVPKTLWGENLSLSLRSCCYYFRRARLSINCKFWVIRFFFMNNLTIC